MKYVPSKKKKADKAPSKGSAWLLRILTLVFVGVFIFSGIKLYDAVKGYAEGQIAYGGLEDLAVVDVPEVEITEDDSPEEVKEKKLGVYERLQQIGADFDALSEINSDVIAWINIPGTALNYPVVQGDDNNYYLKHLFTKAYNVGGCVFLDCGHSPDFSDRHSVLYGHRMNDGTMFTSIQKYKDQSYYDKHSYAILLTPDKNYVIEFFSGYVTNVQDDAWNTRFSSDEKYQDWLNGLMEKSDFISAITPGPGDRVVTLSTCSHAFENARYVLHGVIRESASAED